MAKGRSQRMLGHGRVPSTRPEDRREGEGPLAARGESRTETLEADSVRMQGAAKRGIPEVFKRAATQQTGRIRPNGDVETFTTGC